MIFGKFSELCSHNNLALEHIHPFYFSMSYTFFISLTLLHLLGALCHFEQK